MIDIHTHILPRFDDGAKDSATSLEMLKAEQEQGTKTVVLTSHFYGRKHSPKHFLQRRTDSFARIKDRIPEGIEVRLGAEVHFTGINLSDCEELCSLAIEDTKCILIEFPFTTKWTGELMDNLGELIGETGYTPIIAHIERYDEVLKRPAYVTELVNMGCLIQVNARAFTEKREKGFAFALLKKDLVHCIGSDTHDLEVRTPDLLTAKAEIEKAGLADKWGRAQSIMQEVLDGGQPYFETDQTVKKFLGKYK